LGNGQARQARRQEGKSQWVALLGKAFSSLSLPPLPMVCMPPCHRLSYFAFQ